MSYYVNEVTFGPHPWGLVAYNVVRGLELLVPPQYSQKGEELEVESITKGE